MAQVCKDGPVLSGDDVELGHICLFCNGSIKDADEACSLTLQATWTSASGSYGEITPADAVIDDVLALSEGTLSGLVLACRLAVTDWRDLRVAADHVRAHP